MQRQHAFMWTDDQPSETALLVALMQAFGAVDPADWAEATLAYEVKKQ